MFIAIYATFIFLILRFVVTLFNFISDPKLRRVNRHYNDFVSILIPARDEESNILILLNSILKQDYRDYEVIVLDDDSSDTTYKLCADFAAKHSSFRVIKGKPLPDDWLGKNYACYQLANEAKGDLLLFLDADVKLTDNAINSAVHRMYSGKLSLFSLLPNQQMDTLGEKTVVPLLHYGALSLIAFRLVQLAKIAQLSVACGQFMLFEAGSYRRYQWHEQAKDKVVEDLEIMRLVVGTKLNGECLLANNLVSCRMYRDYHSAIKGLRKSTLGAFRYNIFSLLVYLLLLIAGPMIVLMTLNANLIMMMAGLIILARTMVSFMAGQNPLLNIVLHPVQMVNFVVIAITAIQRQLTRTNVWKGRRV
ncbi:MAG TPA: glycosyltransferase family 2 protein [Mucilaginibacter sp.]|nr:glycosyltransferase family 2 protein [Mucilaginibacter sp.]